MDPLELVPVFYLVQVWGDKRCGKAWGDKMWCTPLLPDQPPPCSPLSLPSRSFASFPPIIVPTTAIPFLLGVLESVSGVGLGCKIMTCSFWISFPPVLHFTHPESVIRVSSVYLLILCLWIWLNTGPLDPHWGKWGLDLTAASAGFRMV